MATPATPTPRAAAAPAPTPIPTPTPIAAARPQSSLNVCLPQSLDRKCRCQHEGVRISRSLSAMGVVSFHLDGMYVPRMPKVQRVLCLPTTAAAAVSQTSICCPCPCPASCLPTERNLLYAIKCLISLALSPALISALNIAYTRRCQLGKQRWLTMSPS